MISATKFQKEKVWLTVCQQFFIFLTKKFSRPTLMVWNKDVEKEKEALELFFEMRVKFEDQHHDCCLRRQDRRDRVCHCHLQGPFVLSREKSFLSIKSFCYGDIWMKFYELWMSYMRGFYWQSKKSCSILIEEEFMEDIQIVRRDFCECTLTFPKTICFIWIDFWAVDFLWGAPNSDSRIFFSEITFFCATPETF